MAELVDARDLKSLGREAVPVRSRLRAPIKLNTYTRKAGRDPGFLLFYGPVLGSTITDGYGFTGFCKVLCRQQNINSGRFSVR